MPAPVAHVVELVDTQVLGTCASQRGGSSPSMGTITKYSMFNAVKEIIWHLTCSKCSNWFTYATMEENLCIERLQFTCPHCGQKSPVEINNSTKE